MRRSFLTPVFRLLALLIAAAAPAAFAAQGAAPAIASLAARMGAPLVSDVAAVPGRSSLVWIRSEAGKQSVFLGGPKSRRLVITFEEDDGRGLSQLGASGDERFVYFVRSAYGLERTAGLTAAARTTLYVVGVAPGAPRRMIQADVSSVSVSPDARWLLYSAGGQIWKIDLRDKDLTADKIVDVRGAQRDLVFSPDGTKVAFVSNRSIYGAGDYSFVAVYALDANRLTYMSPGLGFDQDPAWSPDGRRLAFVRSPVEPKCHRFADFHAGPPFSILVADPDTGLGRPVFTADLGQGSVFSPFTGVPDCEGLYVRPNLFWSADDRLIFPWEKTGWRLLYTAPADGTSAPQVLTPGAFEIMSASLSSDRRSILLTANDGDLIRPHAAVLDLAAQRVTRLAADGLQRALGWCGDARCVLLRSWRDTAPYPAVVVAEPSGAAPEPVDDATAPALRSSAAQMVVSTFVFKAKDGLSIQGVMYKPSHPRPGKSPVVVYAHGGSRSQIFPGATYSPNEALPISLVERGYIFVAINYRSGEGYGLNFREAADYGAKSNGRGDVEDFVDLAAVLAKDPQIDAHRIGVFGASYGGHIVSNLLARHSDLFAAGASLYGVGDWVREMELDNGRPLNLDIPMRSRVEDLAYRSSAISQIDRWKSPLFLAQGDADVSGHMEPNIELWTALTQRGVPVEAHVFPDEQHGFSRWRSKLQTFEALIRFFDRYLQPPAKAPGVSGSAVRPSLDRR